MYCAPAVSMIVSTQVSVTVSVTVSVVPVIRNTTCQKPAICEGTGRFREDSGKQTGKQNTASCLCFCMFLVP